MIVDPDQVCLDEIEASKRTSVLAAMLTIGWPSGVALLLAAFGGIVSHADPAWLLIGIASGLAFGGGFMMFTAYGIGLFAHYWFYGTTISPKRMATVIALIFDGVVFGWLLVEVLRGSPRF
ncbi:MAG: hypothetical protein JWP89_5770 [Schlesneria sp.]|nr:hypothetical protein [Schlesneria sp.]